MSKIQRPKTQHEELDFSNSKVRVKNSVTKRSLSEQVSDKTYSSNIKISGETMFVRKIKFIREK